MLRMLWDWSIGARTFDEGVAVARAGDFEAMSLTWRRAKAEAATGRGVRDLVRYASDHGIGLEFMDGVSCWAPLRVPADAGDEIRAAFDFSPEEAFDFCGEAGLTRIVALAAFNPGDVEISALTQSFGEFCEAAARHDLQVVLEPIASIGGLRSLDDVWAIVRDADRPNGTIMLDTWHFMRCGADFELLGSIPAGRITDVQVVDGPLEPVDDDPWVDGLSSRIEPGQGSLPIHRILSLVTRSQQIHSIGPEWYHPSMDELDATALGRHLAVAMSGLRSPA